MRKKYPEVTQRISYRYLFQAYDNDICLNPFTYKDYVQHNIISHFVVNRAVVQQQLERSR